MQIRSKQKHRTMPEASTEETIIMPIINSITKNVDKLALIGGGLYGLGEAGKPYNLNSFEVVKGILDRALTEPHVPDLGNVFYDLTRGAFSGPLKNMILVYIAGELMDMLKFQPKWAKTLKTVGTNGSIGVLAGDLLLRSTWWHSQKNQSGTFSNSVTQNFAKAPNMGAYPY